MQKIIVQHAKPRVRISHIEKHTDRLRQQRPGDVGEDEISGDG